MGTAEEWERLCRLLDDDETVREAVSAALAAGEDPWEALLDGLDEAGALAYLRSDDTGMELTDALAQLPLVVAARPDLGEATDTDDLAIATATADRLLAPDGVRIVRIVERDSDSWPLVVVPGDRVTELVGLAGSIGGSIEPAA